MRPLVGSHASKIQSDALVQFLGLFDNLLLIFVVTFSRSIFLHLVAKICRGHSHFSIRCRLSQPEIRIIQHLNRQVHTFGAEVKNEGIAFEVFMLVGVKLDAWLPLVNLFGNDSTPRKDVMDFLDRDIQREGGDIDGGVFAFPRLRRWFGFFRVDGSTALFLQSASAEARNEIQRSNDRGRFLHPPR